MMLVAEMGIFAICLYGLIKYGDVSKVAVISSMICVPAMMVFARTGSVPIVLLMLAIEAVPFAFSLLMIKISKTRDYREMWK